MELLARHHLRDRRYGVEGRQRVRIVASAATNASRHLILVVLQRQSHVFWYKYCFGMLYMAEVG